MKATRLNMQSRYGGQEMVGNAELSLQKCDRVYAAVECIPRGRVSTYGRIAELAGLCRGARFVGYALRMLPPESGVAWKGNIRRRRRWR